MFKDSELQTRISSALEKVRKGTKQVGVNSRYYGNEARYGVVSAYITTGLKVAGLEPEIRGRGKGGKLLGKIRGRKALEMTMRGSDERDWIPTQPVKLRFVRTRGPEKGKGRLFSRNARVLKE